MWKIIDLDIDAALSADTGVWEVAWVEMPAIEQEMIFFGRQKFYKAPENVSRIACQAIKENEKRNNPAATQVGKVRGQQLCNRDEISLETIKRMKSYLERAKVYNTDNWDDNGTISWKLWGGQEALDWVDRVLKSLENKEEMAGLEDACWEGYEPIGMKEKDGRMVPNCVPKQQNFVEPSPGESKDDYISRCIPYVIKEGRTPEQAAGKCYGMWQGKFALNKVSFDWDETLSTAEGKKLLEEELRKGNIIYIISARNNTTQSMFDVAKKYNIPVSHIHATGSNKAKIEKIHELGITKHYDNNRDVIKSLGKIGIQFDYIANLPAYQNTTGDTYNQDCGCMKQEEFGLVGYIDGQPVFATKQEAENYAISQVGCQGSHEHTDENGNIVYMPCEVHDDKGWNIESIGQENIYNFAVDEYTEEEKEAYELLTHLRRTDIQEFEAVVGQLRGATLEQVKRRNHKTATTYYLYKRVENGSPDRAFCESIEGRYFRRLEIDLLNPLNKQFGHKQQAYSKWNYKGGPNCVHSWYRVLAIGRNIQEVGPEPGLPGTPPKLMPNNGYFDKDTKKASERAYAISQNMSSQVELTGELLPFDWYDGFPLYEDQVQATDASYLLGCGGVYETVERTGRVLFQACSSNMKKQEMKKSELFSTNEEQRMVYMPLMIPNILIPRLDDTTGERYFVKFSPEVIQKIQQKFMIEQRLRDTNLEHTDYKFQDAVMVESWIVGKENDKVYSLGFTEDQIPAGSWMAAYKILDTPQGNEIWEKYIKPGKVKGGSVEGNFILNFSSQKTDEYLLDEIINIIKNIN